MTPEQLKEYIGTTFAGRMTLLDVGRCEPCYQVEEAALVELTTELRDNVELKCDYLCNMGGTDTGEEFQVHYQIASLEFNHRIDLKVILDRDAPSFDSVIGVWPAANWYEREIWELYGFTVRNHPNLTRFLLPDDWDEGHPMLKDWDAPDFIRLPEFK